MRLRILGETKLRREVTCPYCKSIAAIKNQVIEIVEDMNTNTQYAAFHCLECKENIMMKG